MNVPAIDRFRDVFFSHRGLASGLLGAVMLASGGAMIVAATENPHVRRVLVEFNRPIRQAATPYIARIEDNLPPRLRRQRIPTETIHLATAPARLSPPPQPEAPRPAPLRHTAPGPDSGSRTIVRSIRKSAGSARRAETAYCVRLCDGYAFPIGETARGGLSAQEAACRVACPDATTALYTLPAGARDLDELRRNGLRYTALPAAFRYREQVSESCACKPVGATLPVAALLTDFTLRRGDLVMTRAGARHFDGSPRFPYRGTAFSKALPRLKDRREIAIVRAMEVATNRGLALDDASPHIRYHVREALGRAERHASATRLEAPGGAPRRFEELRPRGGTGVAIRPVAGRAPGLVALN